MPGFDDEGGVEHSIHLHGHVGRYICNGCKIEDSPEEIQRSGKISYDSSPTASGRDGGPMINSPTAWNTGGQLCNRSSNEGVVGARNDELIQNSRWSAV